MEEVADEYCKIVREAREQSRLTALDFANGIFDEFIELHGDRSFVMMVRLSVELVRYQAVLSLVSKGKKSS